MKTASVFACQAANTKARKVDLTGWNDKGNALLWRKAWADISKAYLERAGSPERIDHRSNAERGIGRAAHRPHGRGRPVKWRRKA